MQELVPIRFKPVEQTPKLPLISNNDLQNWKGFPVLIVSDKQNRGKTGTIRSAREIILPYKDREGNSMTYLQDIQVTVDVPAMSINKFVETSILNITTPE